MLYPIRFIPRLKERLWGGHELLAKAKAGKAQHVDATKAYGESWELDRKSTRHNNNTLRE